MSDLADILVKLYPDRDKVRQFLRDREVSMDPDRVNLDGDATLRWEKILEEAWKHQKVGKIVEAAAREYEARRAELYEAMQRDFSGRDVSIAAGRTTPTPLPVTRPGFFRACLDRWFPDLHGYFTRVGTFPEPPELTDIKEYLLTLHAQIENNLGEKTYLPLAGRPVPPSPIAQAANRDPFVSPIHQSILHLAGRAQGGDSASAQIAAVNRQSRVVRNILKKIDQTEEPLILLGEPGSGKTMTLQRAAMMLAAGESRRVFPRVPVYVRLGEFHVEGNVDKEAVWAYVQQTIPPSIQRRIDALAYDGRLVIFFDGMDEMSRKGYSAHTEALSLFAGGSWAKTLFSCRITDFSHTFVHQRLVLLPFDRRQVAEYLNKYITHFPIIISGRSWTLSELAKRIVHRDLPIEANNPFVLWLLCLYLQEKQAWPSSRVELLGFYNEQNYRRKDEERSEDESPFPDMKAVFLEWARFAYLITERNLGSGIPVHVLEIGPERAVAHEMIRIGKRCGVLAESKDQHEHLIRFEHHRFQEYFAARYIHEVQPNTNWLDKLDAPRWQETMLNLILMGKAHDAVHTFTDTIVELTNICRARIACIQEVNELRKKQQEEEKKKQRGEGQSEQGKGQKEPELLEVALPHKDETVLADRVEHSSRIMRQIGSGASRVREVLMPPFREAVSLLAEHGSPITQVKMMRACQNVPDLDFIETLRKPLNSPIKWVRDQALILIAGSQASARVVGADLATEMGYDLANGLFLTRLRAYGKAVYQARSLGYWWSLLAGTLCSLTNVVLLLAAAAAIYWGTWSLRTVDIEPRQNEPRQVEAQSWSPSNLVNLEDWVYFRWDEWKPKKEWQEWLSSRFNLGPPGEHRFRIDLRNFSILSHPICIAIASLVVMTGIGTALKSRPPLLWAAILGSAIGSAVLIPFLGALWLGSGGFLFTVLAYSSFGGMAAPGVGGLIGAPIHFGVLAIYLCATAGIRRSGHSLMTFLVGAWRNCLFNGAFVWLASSLGVLVVLYLGVVAINIVGVIGLSVCQLLNDISHLPFHPLVNILIIAVVATLVSFFIRAGLEGNIAPVLRFVLAGSIGFVLALGLLAEVIFLLEPLWQWLKSLPIWFPLLRIFTVSVWLVALVIFVRFSVPLLRGFMRLIFPGIQKFPPGSFKPEDWKKRIQEEKVNGQDSLLLRTDHQTLSLSAVEFLDVLNEIRPLVKGEPALSTYWDQRYQLEEALKQERYG